MNKQYFANDELIAIMCHLRLSEFREFVHKHRQRSLPSINWDHYRNPLKRLHGKALITNSLMIDIGMQGTFRELFAIRNNDQNWRFRDNSPDLQLKQCIRRKMGNLIILIKTTPRYES